MNKQKALEKIAHIAYDKAIFKDTCSTETLWDIYWLAQAGLQGKSQASQLELATQLSGIPTDNDGKRTI